MTGLAERLAARTLELVDIPSPSLAEERIREHLLALVPGALELEAEAEEAFLFCPRVRRGPLVLLAGHYDTVPAQGNLPGRIADGWVHGLGAADMKGGLAVALELVRDLAAGDAASAYDVGLLLFGREELPAEHDPLPALLERSRAAGEVALAVLLEPTGCAVQAGCLGNVVARLVFRGRSGHAARPWLADSALERAVEGLRPLFSLPPRRALVGGLEFLEVLSVTGLQAGVADNVIPGEAVATLNFRYAPDRTPEEAEAYLRSLVPAGAELVLVGTAPPGRVVADAPLVRALRAAGGLPLEPKQAWTNVADFTARGIDAVNLGPGEPAYAHAPDERVEIAALVRVYEALRRFLARAVREDGG